MKKILVIVVILIAAIFFLRFLTPEDTWIKDPTSFLDKLVTSLGASKAGSWVKHGNPSSPKPTTVTPTRGPLVNKKELMGYCGLSSYGKCESDNDCHISGCSAEVCQSKNEEAIMSACVALACHKKPKEIICGCRSNQCQWQKK